MNWAPCQALLTCDWWFNVDCAHSEELYHAQDNLYDVHHAGIPAGSVGIAGGPLGVPGGPVGVPGFVQSGSGGLSSTILHPVSGGRGNYRRKG